MLGASSRRLQQNTVVPTRVAMDGRKTPRTTFSGTVSDKIDLAKQKIQEDQEQHIKEHAENQLDAVVIHAGNTLLTGREVLKLIDEMGKACECKVAETLRPLFTQYALTAGQVREKLSPFVQAGYLRIGTRMGFKNGYFVHHSLKLTELGREAANAPPSFTAPPDEPVPSDAVAEPAPVLDVPAEDGDSMNYPGDDS